MADLTLSRPADASGAEDQSLSCELVAVLMRRHERGFMIRLQTGEELFYGPDPRVPLPQGLSDEDRQQAEWWRARWARRDARDAGASLEGGAVGVNHG